jgi:hypothetical protein
MQELKFGNQRIPSKHIPRVKLFLYAREQNFGAILKTADDYLGLHFRSVTGDSYIHGRGPTIQMHMPKGQDEFIDAVVSILDSVETAKSGTELAMTLTSNVFAATRRQHIDLADATTTIRSLVDAQACIKFLSEDNREIIEKYSIKNGALSTIRCLAGHVASFMPRIDIFNGLAGIDHLKTSEKLKILAYSQENSLPVFKTKKPMYTEEGSILTPVQLDSLGDGDMVFTTPSYLTVSGLMNVRTTSLVYSEIPHVKKAGKKGRKGTQLETEAFVGDLEEAKFFLGLAKMNHPAKKAAAKAQAPKEEESSTDDDDFEIDD